MPGINKLNCLLFFIYLSHHSGLIAQFLTIVRSNIIALIIRAINSTKPRPVNVLI